MVRGIYEAFGRGDVPAALGQMDQGIGWREAENFIYADRNPYVGPQAVVEGVFARLASEWEGFTVTPEEWLDAGNHVVVLGTYSGRRRETANNASVLKSLAWLAEGYVLTRNLAHRALPRRTSPPSFNVIGDGAPPRRAGLLSR